MMSQFLQTLSRIAQNILTEKDGVTHDVSRWSWVICTVAVLCHDSWQLTHGTQVSLKDLAFALAAVCGAHGFAIGAKGQN